MKKIFHTYIKKYQFHPFERLFDETIRDILKTEYTEKTSTIYAIVETDKISFLPETFRATGNYCVQGNVISRNKEESVIFNIPKTWFYSNSELSKSLKNKFKTYENYIDYHMRQYLDPKKPNLSNAQKYQSLLEVDLERSSRDVLFVKCPIATAGNGGEDRYAELYTFQTLNLFEAGCIGDLNILYIGKSTSSTFDRLKNHEKWGPIMADKNEEKNYLVYFFEIDDNLLLERNFSNMQLKIKASNNIPKDAIVKLCEASLINHYKPKFNIGHSNSLVEESIIVKKWLKSNEYDGLLTEIELEGLMGRICTESQAFKKRHTIELNFPSPNK